MPNTITLYVAIDYLDVVSVGEFEVSVGRFAVNVEECRLFILWKYMDGT